MTTYILPLVKSPHLGGRYGPIERQDWYQGLVMARDLWKKTGAKILVVSNNRVGWDRHETDIYLDTLKELGVPEKDIVVIREGYETIGQLIHAGKYVNDQGARLNEVTVISSFLHYPRVRYICKGAGMEHLAIWGLPRPREAVTDIIMIFLFPAIEMLGLKKWFMEKVTYRRMLGIL